MYSDFFMAKNNSVHQINILNESALHLTLKKIYSLDETSHTEVELDGKIYDIVSDKGNITEIQTQNLGKLLPKIMVALGKKRRVKVVYPLIITKYLETYDASGTLISRRKSPKRHSIYDLFRELTGIYPILLEKNFSLDVVECTACERREKKDEAVQSANGRRRFRKHWLKTDKRLEEIIKTRIFCTAADYLALLPQTLPTEFTTTDIRTALKTDKTLPTSTLQNANIMVWVLSRMEIIKHIGNKGRSKLYTIRS